MVHSPSKRWEDGVLAERAISTNEPGDPVPDDGVSGTKPYKTPVPTTHSPEEREAQRAAAKAVQAAENKSVEPEATTTKAKRKK